MTTIDILLKVAILELLEMNEMLKIPEIMYFLFIKDILEELVDYPENRKYKRIHDPREYIDSKEIQNENR